ncbi:MAG: hypothetical protein CMJ83_07135 [Planctomycetes bacterium]|jgi:hypothetical protein|nr:hypothetical protein [Planctomycetota bacterium]
MSTSSRLTFLVISLWIALAAVTVAQPYQVNSLPATIDLDGVVSTGLDAAYTVYTVGQTATLATSSTLVGWPYEILVVFAPQVPRGDPRATVTLGGQVFNVDLADPTLIYLWSGGAVPVFQPHQNQSLAFQVTAAPVVFTGQMFIIDPTNPELFSLSQASTGTTAGPTVTPITFGGSEPGRPGTLFSLGLPVPFYESTWTTMFVNSDGHVSFGANGSDFTPTPGEFRTGPARAAPQWTDMDPGFAPAQVTVTEDLTGLITGQPLIRVDWNSMAEWANAGSQHTFQLDLHPVTGDIVIRHHPTNLAMIYDQLTGITPGNNLLPPSGWPAYTDLSAMSATPVVGGPNGAFWEWYGIPGAQMPFYTQGFANPFDLTGLTLTFLAMGAGSPGAFYIGM